MSTTLTSKVRTCLARSANCNNKTAKTMLPPLQTLEWLQGSAAEIQNELQIGLLIQPNCPGCHLHALPLANQIYEERESSRRAFDLYVVSTAFEDFEYNTIESTTALVKEGKLVGVSKDRLGEAARAVPTMPVAYDIVLPKSEAPEGLVRMALDATKDNARHQMGSQVPHDTLEAALSRLGPEVLPEKLAHIFHAVKALGTPTWYASTKNGEILDQKFGQITKEEFFGWIEQLVPPGSRE